MCVIMCLHVTTSDTFISFYYGITTMMSAKDRLNIFSTSSGSDAECGDDQSANVRSRKQSAVRQCESKNTF